ncbi:hypothetical protein AB4K20DRAFT_1995076 [Rhizopus microsporus]|uniref:Uncharacterized protein n=1 Tax=Rhizopus microsporus TaxID=58291 RepID=A0A1X0S8G9_RHIZD|nr:hypothetical protein BCV71DRAFT_254166 [Rhizopus microsporus]
MGYINIRQEHYKQIGNRQHDRFSGDEIAISKINKDVRKPRRLRRKKRRVDPMYTEIDYLVSNTLCCIHNVAMVTSEKKITKNRQIYKFVVIGITALQKNYKNHKLSSDFFFLQHFNYYNYYSNMGSIFSCLSGIVSSIASLISSVVSAIAGFFQAIISGITSCIIGIFNAIAALLTCRCCGGGRRRGTV